MNIVIRNVSTGDSMPISEQSLCSWGEHKVCIHHGNEYQLPCHLRVVGVSVFPALKEAVIYVKEEKA